MPLHANVDIPAHLSAALLLGLVGGWAVLLVVWFVAWWRRRSRVASTALWLGFLGTLVYAALLYGYAGRSMEKTLARGVEKHFCELDCHLAYAVVGVEQPRSYSASGAKAVQQEWKIKLRTRFDEKTIRPGRGNSPLRPNPRLVEVVDRSGRRFRPLKDAAGAPLGTPLRPGESYVTELAFSLPLDIKEPRLLITETVWPSYIGIGSENSPGHRKTYFSLE